jgi:hypothetical protein
MKMSLYATVSIGERTFSHTLMMDAILDIATATLKNAMTTHRKSQKPITPFLLLGAVGK